MAKITVDYQPDELRRLVLRGTLTELQWTAEQVAVECEKARGGDMPEVSPYIREQLTAMIALIDLADRSLREL